MNNEDVCLFCGAQLNSFSSCQDLVYQLSYYTLSLQDKDFIHQLVVDAYAAQHSEKNPKPITTAFALIGLYLINEKDYTGRQVQKAHMALAKKSKVWPKFSLQNPKEWLTVADVLKVPDNKKQEAIKNWIRSVWNVWQSEKETIEELFGKYLDKNKL